MYIPKVEEKHYFCFRCNNELDFDRIKMQRTDTCPHCSQDMHCCRNCEYWDPGYHNECREQITEYVTDRERVNQLLRAGGLSPLHNVRQVILVAAIPVLGTGKTDYRGLRSSLALDLHS